MKPPLLFHSAWDVDFVYSRRPHVAATRFPLLYYGPRRLSHPNLTKRLRISNFFLLAAPILLVFRQTLSIYDPPFVLTIATVLVDTLDPRSVPLAHFSPPRSLLESLISVWLSFVQLLYYFRLFRSL